MTKNISFRLFEKCPITGKTRDMRGDCTVNFASFSGIHTLNNPHPEESAFHGMIDRLNEGYSKGAARTATEILCWEVVA